MKTKQALMHEEQGEEEISETPSQEHFSAHDNLVSEFTERLLDNKNLLEQISEDIAKGLFHAIDANSTIMEKVIDIISKNKHIKKRIILNMRSIKITPQK